MQAPLLSERSRVPMAPSHSAGASIWGITSTASQAKISTTAGSYHLLDPGSQPPLHPGSAAGRCLGGSQPPPPCAIWDLALLRGSSSSSHASEPFGNVAEKQFGVSGDGTRLGIEGGGVSPPPRGWKSSTSMHCCSCCARVRRGPAALHPGAMQRLGKRLERSCWRFGAGGPMGSSQPQPRAAASCTRQPFRAAAARRWAGLCILECHLLAPGPTEMSPKSAGAHGNQRTAPLWGAPDLAASQKPARGATGSPSAPLTTSVPPHLPKKAAFFLFLFLT